MSSKVHYNLNQFRPNPDSMVDMKFITTDCLLSDKWIYKLIAQGKFPKPIKIGRMSRWKASDYYSWRDSHMAASN
ncbi:helix-turn-helix transcriptional regulator [Pectobacterium carotovorum]